MTDAWAWREREVIIRDEYTCQHCGRKGGPEGGVELTAQHVTPREEGGTDDKDNLIALCQKCVDREDRNLGVDDVYRVLREVDRPVLTTGDIKDEFDLESEEARYQLRRLVEDGVLLESRIGSGLIYWPPGEYDL